MKKVLIVGNVLGSYRSQILLDYLSNRNYHYTFLYIPTNFFVSKSGSFLSRLGNKFYELLFIPFLYFVAIWSSDSIFYLPMNTSNLWVLRLGSFLKKDVIFDFYISRYVVSVDNQKLGNPSSQKFDKEFDLFTYTYSSKIIFLNESEKNYYGSVLGFNYENKEVYTFPLKSPVRKNAKLDGFEKLKDRFTVCWWGKASSIHGIEVMLDSISELSLTRTDFEVFLFDNDRQRAEYLRELISNYKMGVSIQVRDDLTFANGLEAFLVENCDIALGSFGTSAMAGAVLLNKVVDSVALGIPMVTQYSSAIDEFLLEGIVRSVESCDRQTISSKIDELMNSDFSVKKFHLACEEKFNQHFNSLLSYPFYDKLFSK